MQDRRRFLQTLAGMTAGLALGETGFGAEIQGPRDRIGDLVPLRPLGGTGEKVTMLGVGGWHIGGAMSEKEAQKTIETAIRGGVRFFDTAENYSDGESERRYGRFLSPRYRDIAFIMTKALGKDAKSVREQLEGSLRRMKTDYIDLWQMHSIQGEADAERRAENGVVDVLRRAQQEGKVRYIGFTGHRTPRGHNRMLDLFPDAQSVQMPINAADPGDNSFIDNVMPRVIEQGAAPLAMKTLADGAFFGDRGYQDKSDKHLIPDVLSIDQAMRFAWSLPVSVLISGANDAAMFQQKIDMLRRFRKMSKGDRQQLVADVNEAQQRLRVEYYKA